MDYAYVNFDQAFRHVCRAIKANKVPYLIGAPGLGKSALAKLVAKVFNLLLIDERLSTSEPTDWRGLPALLKNGKASYRPFDTLPLDGEELPINPETGKRYSGYLLFFDELPAAAAATIAAAYKPILDREVGAFKLHKRLRIMAAGNTVHDNAIVNEIGTAMQSRLITLMLKSDADITIKHAAEQGWDSRVIGFLNFKRDLVNNFDPESEDVTFACERTWEFMSDLCKNEKEITYELMPLFAGTIGMGAAQQFLAFCDYFGQLPKIEQIIADPQGCVIPDDPGIHWATTTLIAEHIDEKNAPQLMEFLPRLDIDMQVITMRQALRANRSLNQVSEVRQWKRNNADEFLADVT
jgi:energy-coupling factor transporter ATP-binding protein EcfA2